MCSVYIHVRVVSGMRILTLSILKVGVKLSAEAGRGPKWSDPDVAPCPFYDFLVCGKNLLGAIFLQIYRQGTCLSFVHFAIGSHAYC